MLKKFAPIFLSLILTSSVALAGDHEAGLITGTDLNLSEKNHAFAGQILGSPVFGAFDHQPFGGRVVLRKGEQTLEMQISKNGRIYSGAFTEDTLSTAVQLGKIERGSEPSAVIHLMIDGNDVAVKITGEKFENDHFIAPRFEAEIGGKTVAFSFSGEACYGYSSNLAMMILGAYAHLQK